MNPRLDGTERYVEEPSDLGIVDLTDVAQDQRLDHLGIARGQSLQGFE